jgi:hypothetical protein
MMAAYNNPNPEVVEALLKAGGLMERFVAGAEEQLLITQMTARR